MGRISTTNSEQTFVGTVSIFALLNRWPRAGKNNLLSACHKCPDFSGRFRFVTRQTKRASRIYESVFLVHTGRNAKLFIALLVEPEYSLSTVWTFR